MRTRLPLLLALWLLPLAAHADPISVQLVNDVPAGKRPLLNITALEPVRNLRIELDRDDGQHFTLERPALARKQAASFAVGDGKPGRAHYQGKLTLGLEDGGAWSFDLSFDTLVRGAALEVGYDDEHLDLAARVLEFRLSRPAKSAELSVLGEDGKALATSKASYQGEPPGTWLPIRWNAERPGNVLKLELRVVATDGSAARLELFPWSLAIEHEEVNFASGSADIAPGEQAKLAASLQKIGEAARRVSEYFNVRLYVAGHTDSVGSREQNRKLSRARAQAIARYFRQHGLTLPISFEGFGEEALKVPTADETDEARNRRTDYVLGAAEAPPPVGLGRRGVRGEWKALP